MESTHRAKCVWCVCAMIVCGIILCARFQSELSLSATVSLRRTFSLFSHGQERRPRRHAYDRYYESKLAPYRDKPGLRILLIVAKYGQTLSAWRQKFSRPAPIQGAAYRADPIQAKKRASVAGRRRFFPEKINRVRETFVIFQDCTRGEEGGGGN